MSKPLVMKSRRTGNWLVLYRSHQVETFQTWRDAFDHAYNWARVSRPRIGETA